MKWKQSSVYSTPPTKQVHPQKDLSRGLQRDVRTCTHTQRERGLQLNNNMPQDNLHSIKKQYFLGTEVAG